MKTETALKHFGGKAALCDAADVTRQAVERWIASGVVPRGTAYRLQVQTGGALKVDERVYQRRQVAA